MRKRIWGVMAGLLLVFLAACNNAKPSQPFQGVTTGGGTTACFGGGCGGTGGGGGTPAQNANFFVFMTAHGGDSVAALSGDGVAALSFDLTTVTLTKTDTTTEPFGSNLSALEVAGTRLSPKLMAAASVPQASYVTMSGTLAASTVVRAGSNTVTTLPPFTSTLAIPISVTVGTSPVAILLDMDIDGSINPGASPTYNPRFTVSALTLGAAALQAQVDDQLAKVTAVDVVGGTFTVTLNSSAIDLTVKTDAATGFGGTTQTPLTSLNDLQVNDTIILNGVLDTDLKLLAGRVDAEFRGNLAEQTGMINAWNPINLAGKLALREGVPPAPVASVDFNPTGAVFEIQAEALTVGGFSFDSTSVLVGQGVGLQQPTPAPQPISTVLLKNETIRGRVASKGPNFVDITPSGAQFTSQGITSLRVVIDPTTLFTNTSLSGLNTGDTISVRGLLFLVSGSPQMLAKTVRRDG